MKKRASRRLTPLVVGLAVLLPPALAAPGGATLPIQAVCDLDRPGCADGLQGLDGARGIALSPDDNHLYLAASEDDALLVFARHAGLGQLDLVQRLIDADAGGVVDGLTGVAAVAVSPDGLHVYTAAAGDSALAAWGRDAVTGAVAFIEVELDGAAGVDGLGGARAVAISPDGRHVYVASRDDHAVAVFARDAATGALTFVEAELDGVGANDGLAGAAGLAVSPDGKHVYVAGQTDNALAVFARQADDAAPDFGELTFVEAQLDGAGPVDGLAGASAVALDSAGDNVYAASRRGALAGDDWAAVFSRDPATGALTFLHGLDESDFAIFGGCWPAEEEDSTVALSPDDAHVHLTNPYRGTVATFTRSAVDGSLTLLDSVCDRAAGAGGLSGVVALAPTGDGAAAYATSPELDTVTTLCLSDTDLDLTDTGSVADERTEVACRSLVAGGTTGGYTVAAPGDVTFMSPEIVLTNGFRVDAGAVFAVLFPRFGLHAPLPPAVEILFPADGEGVLPSLGIDIGYRVADDRLVESYQLSAGGDVLLAATGVDQALIEGTVAWVPPAGAQVGDTFPIALQATDYSGATTLTQVTVEVPDGLVLTGDQNLDSTYDGQSLVLADGTFTVLEPLSLAALNLVQGAVVRSVNGQPLDLTVAGELRVGTGALINVDRQGYPGGRSGSPDGGAPPGIVGSQTNAGGSHGGSGTKGSGAGLPGEVFDSVYRPSLGGGGGAEDTGTCCDGYPGGGVVLIDAATVALHGEIRARGGSTGSIHYITGAGGTVALTTASLSGAGTIDASGGDNSYCYAGPGIGGGGRVALAVDAFAGFDPRAQVTARGGVNGCASTDPERRGAAPGTVYAKQPGDTYGRLLVDAGEYANGDDLPGLVTELPGLGEGPVVATEVAGADLWVTAPAAFFSRWLGAWMRLADAAGGDLGTFEVIEIDGAGRALLAGAGGVAGAAGYAGEYRFDELRLANGGGLAASDELWATTVVVEAGAAELPRRLSATDLTIESGATVRAATDGTIEAAAGGTLTIEPGATVDVTGQGYRGGTSSSPDGGAPPGIVGSQTNAGGSHGGSGTKGDGAGLPGEVFDSVYRPSLGGGGGAEDTGTCCSGYAGGGVVTLEAGTLVLDGEIRSRGLSTGSTHYITGAGGTVSVTAASLTGAGTIDASGGDNSNCYADAGIGGGGRVALAVDAFAGFDPAAQVTARGGINGCASTSSTRRGGAPGTLFVKQAGDTYGRLAIDPGEYANGDDQPGLATELPALGSDPVAATEVAGADLFITGPAAFFTRWLGAWMTLADAAGADLGTFEVIEIDGSGRALLAGAGGVFGAASYRGEYRFDELRLANGGDLTASDALTVTTVAVDEGASALPRRLSAVDMTLAAGAVASAGAEGIFEATVSGTLTIEAGAALDLTGQGYPGGRSGSPDGGAPPGITGSQINAGGSHGGVGSKGSGSGAAGEVFDSVYRPRLGGGGGAEDVGTCCDGYPGGGVVSLEVGALVLDGVIRSRGLSTASIHYITGAGGTVAVAAQTVSGGGTIDVAGGDNSNCFDGAGLGGGGRVALTVDVFAGFDPAAQISARGGVNGCASTSSTRRGAAPGTVYLKQPADTYGRLVVDAGEYANGDDLPALVTELPALGDGPVAAAEVAGPDLWVTPPAAFLTRWLGAWMALVDAAGGDLGTFEVVEIDGTGRARLAGAGAVVGVASYRGEYRFDQLGLANGGDLTTSDGLMVTSLTVTEGASGLPPRLQAVDVTLAAGAVASAVGGILEASVTGTLTIEAGAALDVTGQGYAGGTSSSPVGGAPPAVRGARPDAGGSHGGRGLFTAGGPPGEEFDSVYAPSLPGGGGAEDDGTCCDGRAGGGVLTLDVDTLILQGEIRSRGAPSGSSQFSTGAGGTISLTVQTLSGAGLIDASGGDNGECSPWTGLGGGGRVALSVDTLNGFDPATQVQAFGGVNGCAPSSSSSRTASPGTVFLTLAGDTLGELTVRHADPARRLGLLTYLPSIGTGTIGTTEADAADPTALWIAAEEIVAGHPWLFDLGVVGMWVRVGGADYRVVDQSADRQRLLLAGAAGAVTTGDAYQGVYKFDRLFVRDGAVLVAFDLVEATAVEVDGESQLLTAIVDPDYHAIADCAPVSGPGPLTVKLRTQGVYSGGAIERYRWDFEGDGAYETNTEVPIDYQRVYDQVGTRWAVLEVFNNLNDFEIDRCLIAVHPNAPTAMATVAPSNGPAPLGVSLTCTGSDVEGPIALYEWDFEGDGTFDYSSPATGATTHTYVAEGEFTAVCRVTDGDGDTALAPTTDTVVRVTPPGSPTVEASATPTAGPAPLLVDFSGTATDDGTIVLWEWDFDGNGSYDYASGIGPDTSHTYTSGGLFAAALRVTDDTALSAVDNVGISVAVDATLSIPDDTFEPAVGETVAIDTTLTGDAAVRILIKDGAGVARRVLVDEFRLGGAYSDLWDGTDDLGQPLPHGAYFAVLEYTVGGVTLTVDPTDVTGGTRYSPPRPDVPASFAPFANDPLEIDFTIPAASGASEVLAFVGLFNTNERFVTLVNREPFGVGGHRLVWDGIDADGNLAVPPPGDYLLVGLFGYELPDNAIMLEAAPTISNVTVAPNLFDPATPDFITPGNPTATITYDLDRTADVELTVTNLDTGVVLRQVLDPMVAAGTDLTITWDGRAADGRFADRGDYRLTLRAVDTSGNASLARLALMRVHY